MKHPINIHWLGIRKDSGRGSIWGYFTLENSEDLSFPRLARDWSYVDLENKNLCDDGWIRHYCYTFSGKIGKSIYIEKKLYTNELSAEIESKKKNYKSADIEKITSKWGKAIDEELSMFLTYAVLAG